MCLWLIGSAFFSNKCDFINDSILVLDVSGNRKLRFDVDDSQNTVRRVFCGI